MKRSAKDCILELLADGRPRTTAAIAAALTPKHARATVYATLSSDIRNDRRVQRSFVVANGVRHAVYRWIGRPE